VADLAERAGVRLPELASETVARLRTVLPAFGSIGNPLDTTDRGVYDAQNMYSGSIRALADDPSVSLVAVVQDCSPGLSVRGASNYRRIAQTVADAAGEIAKPVVFFNTSANGLPSACDRAVRWHRCRGHAGRACEPTGNQSSFRACAVRTPAVPQALAPAPE
jgi:acetate---CoA ligase (ADP-forming)